MDLPLLSKPSRGQLFNALKNFVKMLFKKCLKCVCLENKCLKACVNSCSMALKRFRNLKIVFIQVFKSCLIVKSLKHCLKGFGQVFKSLANLRKVF